MIDDWWDESETHAHLLLAKSNSYWPNLKSSFSESAGMGSQSCSDVIQLRNEIHLIVPKSFSDDGRTLGNLLVEIVAICVFCPDAGLPTDDIHILHAWLEAICLSPVSEISVVDSIHVVEAEIEVNFIFICKGNWIFLPKIWRTLALMPHHSMVSSSSIGRLTSSFAQ